MKKLLIIFLALCIPFGLLFVAGLTLWGLLKLFWVPALVIVGIKLMFVLIDTLSAKYNR